MGTTLEGEVPFLCKIKKMVHFGSSMSDASGHQCAAKVGIPDPMSSTTVKSAILPELTPMAAWGVSYDPMIEEKS